MTDPTAMYDPHSGHRPGLPGLPPHHSPHMNHATAGMHGYHGTPSHVSQPNHMGGAVQPDKRDKEAIYG
jgi:homeobox protein homothorax